MGPGWAATGDAAIIAAKPAAMHALAIPERIVIDGSFD
jgi:hypothetical protein